MKKKFTLILTGLFLVSIFLLFTVKKNKIATAEVDKQTSDVLKTSGAGQAMDMWSFERAYPYDKIPTAKFSEAFEQKRQAEQQRAISIDGEWENMGPKILEVEPCVWHFTQQMKTLCLPDLLVVDFGKLPHKE